jgi:hypothetical protein
MKTPDAEILVRLAEKRLRIHGLTIDQYTLVAEQFVRVIEMFYQSENWIRAVKRVNAMVIYYTN